jgi:dephospho-CoA kinase
MTSSVTRPMASSSRPTSRQTRRPDLILLGLTGGIAAGKSTALGAFARAGCPVLSSDAVVHELYRRPEIRDAVVDRLGARVLDSEGTVDRGALAAIAFADPDVLAFLEQLLHPLVERERERFREAAAGSGARVAVQEVPLLFERGSADRYDRTVLITAPEELRRARDPRVALRQAHQMPEDEKRALADEVYVNDGPVEALEAWVAALVERLSA